jgi:hypothetical protein
VAQSTLSFQLTNVQWGQMDGIALYCEGEKTTLGKVMWVEEKDSTDKNLMANDAQVLTLGAGVVLGTLLAWWFMR